MDLSNLLIRINLRSFSSSNRFLFILLFIFVPIEFFCVCENGLKSDFTSFTL